MRNNLPLLDKYERILKEDKKSVVFAPLAEIYRKSGEFKKAIKVCKKGLSHNQNYLSGIIVLAHCYYELEDFKTAHVTLEKHVDKNADNILLQKLWGKVNLSLNKTQVALNCFKKLLFLFPSDLELSELVENLEADISPLRSDILDDENNKINLKNWEQKPLVDIEIKKNKTTPISFAKLFNDIGDSDKVNEILCNIEEDISEKVKEAEVRSSQENVSIEEKTKNKLMDYFDLKVDQISSLIDDGEVDLLEPQKVSIDDKIAAQAQNATSGKVNTRTSDYNSPTAELLSEVKFKCDMFLNLLRERRELSTANS